MDKGHDTQDHHLGNGQVAVGEQFVFQSGQFGAKTRKFIDQHIGHKAHQGQSNEGQQGALEKAEKKSAGNADGNDRQKQQRPDQMKQYE